MDSPDCDICIVPDLQWFSLTIFQFYDSAKAVDLQQKLYFEFWLLVFSQAGDMQYSTPHDVG